MSVALFLILLLAGAVATGVALRMRWRRRRACYRRVFNDLLVPNVSDEHFAARDVVLLPHPVSRFLRHSVPTDRPLARTVDLDFVGETRSRADSQWLRFEARQRVCPGRGFLWQTRLEGIGPMAAEGAEFLFQGRAEADYCLGGWLPLVRARDDEFWQMAAERLMVESFWLPSSVLPDQGVHWREQDQNRATALFPAAAGEAAINVTIDDQGALTELSMVRLRRTARGLASKTPFGIRFDGIARFDGYTIPRSAVAVWNYGTDAGFEFMRLNLETARFY